MEAFIAILRTLAENGWRAGLPLLLFGAAVLVADRFGFPAPNMFRDWLGFCALAASAGFAIVATSIVTNLVDALSRWRERRRQRRDEEQAVLSNLETLRGREIGFLFEALSSSQRRFEIYKGSEEFTLLAKRILIAADYTRGGEAFLCDLPPAVLAHRDRLLPVLKAIVERGGVLTWSPPQ